MRRDDSKDLVVMPPRPSRCPAGARSRLRKRRSGAVGTSRGGGDAGRAGTPRRRRHRLRGFQSTRRGWTEHPSRPRAPLSTEASAGRRPDEPDIEDPPACSISDVATQASRDGSGINDACGAEVPNDEECQTQVQVMESSSLSSTYVAYLRQLSRSWSSISASKLLTADLVRYIKPRYHRCSTPLKVRILTSLLYMPPALREECYPTLRELLMESESDRDDWVRKLSRLLHRYVASGYVALQDLDSEMVYRIIRYIDHQRKNRPLRFKPSLEYGLIADVLIDPPAADSLLGPTVAAQLEALKTAPLPPQPQPPHFRPGAIFTDFTIATITAAERALRSELRRLTPARTESRERELLRRRLLGPYRDPSRTDTDPPATAGTSSPQPHPHATNNNNAGSEVSRSQIKPAA